MPTITTDSHTASISIEAAPDAVIDVIADPTRLPEWAPDFARAVRTDGEHWIVENDAGELPIRVRVDRALGVVDLLARDAEVGAFSRVIPNATGSELLFTVFFADGTPSEQIAAQRRVIAAELERVRSLAT
jgi:hypothetical protein